MLFKSIPKLIISIIIPQLAGLIGSIFTTSSISSWYSKLTKPSFNPPNWIFGPVWTTLFVLMGISFYLVWTSGKNIKLAVTIFIVQLVLNTLWSILFFGMQNPFAAFIELIFLWIAILATIIIFYRISPTAAYLLVPYLLWVSFAGILNYSIYSLN
ncbi:MAG: tryptophan-rich sensory protein [Nanoarchaeota archaeon]|nr:tryptophan-rich sensory protein [Nanoarchaeota archaeon]